MNETKVYLKALILILILLIIIEIYLKIIEFKYEIDKLTVSITNNRNGFNI
jgi:hypothetical protein